MSVHNAVTYADDALVVAGIVVLVVRQFVWRSADPARLLRLPQILLACGVGELGWVAVRGGPLRSIDAAVLAAELALVWLTGTVMGAATVFRDVAGGLQYRLSGAGVALWGLFLVIRVGSFLLARHLGAHLLESSGAILVSFGTNRLARSLVVRRRALSVRPATLPA